MSRSKASKRPSGPFSSGGEGYPTTGLFSTPQRARFSDDQSPLVHPARDPRGVKTTHSTVRPSIRTVLTDTNVAYSAGRPSPSVPRRATGRSNLWYRSLPEPYSAPPQLPGRAVRCAKDAIRREVIFAAGVGGSRRKYSGRKSPSSTNCRRK